MKLLVFLLLLLPSLALAQPTVTTVTPITGTGATSCGASIDATGTNTGMLAAIALASSAPVSTVTDASYNSVPMTFVVARTDSQDAARIEYWYLHAPTTGSNSFVANFSDLVDFACEVYVLENTRQTGAVGNTSVDAQTSSSTSLNLASAATELVFDAVVGEGSGGDCTPGGSQAERYDDDSPSLHCGSTLVGSASTTLTQTLNNGPWFWAAAAVAIKQPAAAAATIRRKPILIQ